MMLLKVNSLHYQDYLKKVLQHNLKENEKDTKESPAQLRHK